MQCIQEEDPEKRTYKQLFEDFISLKMDNKSLRLRLDSERADHKKLKKQHIVEKRSHNQLKKQFNEETIESMKRNNVDRMLLDVLEGERSLAIKLLYTMVPPKIARDLSNGVEVPPEMFKFCVVFFSDIEGFTAFGDSRTPLEVFDMLDGLFSVMDYVSTCFPALYKVETVGDAYMVVGGILDIDDVDDQSAYSTTCTIEERVARSMIEFSILVNESVQRVDMEEGRKVKIRIGVHYGPVVTGLTGSLTPRYCIFGDTVNSASRMESTGMTTKIHISKKLASFIKNAPYADQYNVVPRDTLTDVKGKGLMETFFLESSSSRDIFKEFEKELAHVDSLVLNSVTNRNTRATRNCGDNVMINAVTSSNSISAGPIVRFGVFNMVATGPVMTVLNSNDNSDAGKSVSCCGSQNGSISSAGRLSSLTHTAFISGTSHSLNDGHRCDLDEIDVLRRRCKAFETKYRDANSAKSLNDQDRVTANFLMEENEARAVALREKNILAAEKLRFKIESRAKERADIILQNFNEMALMNPSEAERIKLKADIEEMKIKRAQDDKAALLLAKNTKKANDLIARNSTLASIISQQQVETAISLEIDQAVIAGRLKLADDEELAKPNSDPETENPDCDEASSGCSKDSKNEKNNGGSGNTSMSSKKRERLAKFVEDSETRKGNAAITAMVKTIAQAQNAYDTLLQEEEMEAQFVAEEAEKALDNENCSEGSSSECESRPSSGCTPMVCDRSSDSVSSDDTSNLSKSLTLLSSTGSSNQSSSKQQRTKDEIVAGILPYTFADFMDRDFDVLCVSYSQPLAITRAILIIIEGVTGDLSEINVAQQAWCKFLWKIGSKYNHCAYHNYHHAFTVVQFMAILLRSTGAMEKLKPKELFVALIAAAIHDVDHRGFNNTFHVNSKSQLAIKYDGKSPLEKHHLDVTFEIMRDPSSNPLARWSADEQNEARKNIQRMVLQTDMSVHNDLVRMLQEHSEKDEPFDFNNQEDKGLYLEAILHAADISNSVRPFKQSEILAARLAVEFNTQAEKEHAMGLPVQAHMVQRKMADVCKGEIGFLTSVAKPYWKALGRCFDQTLPEIEALDRNVQCWSNLSENLEKSSCTTESIAARILRCTGNEPTEAVSAF